MFWSLHKYVATTATSATGPTGATSSTREIIDATTSTRATVGATVTPEATACITGATGSIGTSSSTGATLTIGSSNTFYVVWIGAGGSRHALTTSCIIALSSALENVIRSSSVAMVAAGTVSSTYFKPVPGVGT